jgi:2-isopropylmalate synthase
MKTNRLIFFDTTLRDGEQAPGCSMTVREKLQMAQTLDALGVDIIEAGFAMASDGDSSAISVISHEIKGPCIASMARSCKEDIEAAARALEPARRSRIHIVLASSDLHLEYKLRITRAEALDRAASSVALASRYVDEVEFSPEDATRSDPDFLCQMVTVVVEAGGKVINLPDTVGYCIPSEYAAMFHMVRSRVPQVRAVTLSSHCHNDLGLAVANTLAAISAGAQQVECTINGIGERAGNASLEEVAAAMHVRRDQFPAAHGLVLSQLYPASELLSKIIGFGPQPNKAVVGRNAFAHEAGIHQHGVLANRLTYEIMKPEIFGIHHDSIVLGKHSGRRALAHRLQELGVVLDPGDLNIAYRRFTELADRKKLIFDLDLLALVPAHKRQSPAARDDVKCLEPISSPQGY